MRLKSRKLKLKSQNTNKKPIIIIAIAVVVVIAVVAGVLLFSNGILSIKDGKAIKQIYIAKSPDKIEYVLNESPSYDGLIVMAELNNGDTYQIPEKDLTITGFNSAIATNNCRVKVSYKQFTAYFTVIINEKVQSTPIPSQITMETLPKTEYKVGDRLSTTGGMILCEYTDGSTQRIAMMNKDVVSGFTTQAPGTYEVTVKYKENGIVVYTTYTITVTE